MHSLIKGSCAAASADIGKTRADRIASSAQKRFEELKADNATDPRALAAHTYKRIYPAIAVYETMTADGISSEKAVRYVREYFQQYSRTLVPPVRNTIRRLGLAKKIPAVFRHMALKSYGPEAGFRYEIPDQKENEARLYVLRCPYDETCRKYGCPELVTAFCDADDAMYGHLHPKLKWGRTITIGRGGDCCDFLLQYKE